MDVMSSLSSPPASAGVHFPFMLSGSSTLLMCKIASSIFLLSVSISLLLLSAKFTYSLLFYNGNNHPCCCPHLGGPSENAITELNQSNELSMNDAIGEEGPPSPPSQDLAPAKGPSAEVIRPSLYYIAPKDDKNMHHPNGFEPTVQPPMPMITMAPKSAILIPIATLIVHHSNSEPMGCQNNCKNCCGNCCNCCGRRYLTNRKCAKCHQNEEEEESKSAEIDEAEEEEDEEEYGSRKKYGKGERNYWPSKNCEEIGEKFAEKCRWPCEGRNARIEESDEFNSQNQKYSTNGQQREPQKVPMKLFRPFFARNANHGVFNSPPIDHKEPFDNRPRSRSATIDESFETLKERFSTRLGQLSSKLDLWKNLHRLQKTIDAQEKKFPDISNISSNKSGMPTPINFRARSLISTDDQIKQQQSDQNVRGRSLVDNILKNNKNMQKVASTTQSTLVETKIGVMTTIKPTTAVFGVEHELTPPPSPPPITATMAISSITTQWIRMAQSNNSLVAEVPKLTRVEGEDLI